MNRTCTKKLRARRLPVLLAIGTFGVTALGAPGSALATPSVASAASAQGPSSSSQSIVVSSGETRVISTTTRLSSLTIQEGGSIVAPDAHSLTLTVNGVETGGVLTKTGGAETVIAPGTYRGKVVLTVTDQTPVAWQTLSFPFRQAIYVDTNKVVASKSVSASVVGGTVTDTAAKGVRISSTGENFNGVYVTDSNYALTKPVITLRGNGRSDFVGFGAAVTATGKDTTLVLDGAKINNTGVTRPAVVADGGSNVIVKNSILHTEDGVLPSDYVETVDLARMQSAPWMLGISGNVRATNLLGTDTRATYIGSDVSSSGWGVLSTDMGQNVKLTAIDSKVETTGHDGYGAYAIGGATERFLGTRFDVSTYAAIITGGSVAYGDSTRSAVSGLNTELELGLTAKELKALKVRPTIVDSERFGVMWHGSGSVDVSGKTVIQSDEALFLNKGQAVDITVDGSHGAKLKTGNGVLLEVMQNDDPGPTMVDGELVNAGIYTEPTKAPVKNPAFAVTQAHSDDSVATFTDISLDGSFYNGMRDGKNMALTFDRSRVRGVISASTTRHNISTITSAEYLELGEVSNTVGPVVNNGVILNLSDDSTWTATGTSYLSSLTVSADSEIRAPRGMAVSMTVDGVRTTIAGGRTYTGAITVSVR